MTIPQGQAVPFPLADFTADMDREEGFKLAPYRDSLGNWTGGRGHYIGNDAAVAVFNREHPKPSKLFWENLFGQDVQDVLAGLDKLAPWWRTLDPVRQCVVASMAFQLGAKGFILGWPFTVGLIQDHSYVAAKGQMLLSKWASQCPNRAKRLGWMMANGNRNWPKEYNA